MAPAAACRVLIGRGPGQVYRLDLALPPAWGRPEIAHMVLTQMLTDPGADGDPRRGGGGVAARAGDGAGLVDGLSCFRKTNRTRPFHFPALSHPPSIPLWNSECSGVAACG